MRARWRYLGERWRSSYWLIPTLMLAAAVALSVVTLSVDRHMTAATEPGWVHDVLYTGGAQGARQLLGVVASSMVTVAGVVFSITIVALTLASNQFGPRLLASFMSDRGNQVTLGIFVSTFLYCLIVLRTIRSGDTERVPHLSVASALAFAVAGLSVLIYFIHHVAEKIQAPNLVATIGSALLVTVERLFPHSESTGLGTSPSPLDGGFDQTGRAVRATTSGYVGVVDLGRLVRTATELDVHVRLDVRPGDFVVAGTALALVTGTRSDEPETAQRLMRTIVISARRTPIQDFELTLEQLVDVCVRALSPSTNDPFTAVSGLDWIGAMLSRLAELQLPAPVLVDDTGRVRILVTRPVTFDEVVARALRPIRESAGFHTDVYVAIETAIAGAIERTDDPTKVEPLVRQAVLTQQATSSCVPQPEDRRRVTELHQRVMRSAGEADVALG